mmetsp:Transcript_22665/g.70591  ORF Transcript_22665/g.70591 Transcript_22665/m.70591 type:complete len:240 (+) Transcript_22665:179-898(+)
MLRRPWTGPSTTVSRVSQPSCEDCSGRLGTHHRGATFGLGGPARSSCSKLGHTVSTWRWALTPRAPSRSTAWRFSPLASAAQHGTKAPVPPRAASGTRTSHFAGHLRKLAALPHPPGVWPWSRVQLGLERTPTWALDPTCSTSSTSCRASRRSPRRWIHQHWPSLRNSLQALPRPPRQCQGHAQARPQAPARPQRHPHAKAQAQVPALPHSLSQGPRSLQSCRCQRRSSPPAGIALRLW